ncbi:dihydroorotase [soil metagenome]
MRLEIAGMVDPHVHLRDLDWSAKATFESETAAALAGGYWAVLDMPNTPPATVSSERLASKAERLAVAARCDFGLYLGADGEATADRYRAAAPGAVGLKVYCDATTGELLISDQPRRRAHLLAWARVTRRPVAVHAEGASLEAVLALVRELRVRVHFCHVSERREIDALRLAKGDGLPVSVGVTPHHLTLTADDAARLGGYGLVRPALKEPSDVDALWAGVADGTVDVVESDHAPHTRAEKESADPPFGLPGLETTLPILGLAMHEGRLDSERLVELVAYNPQRIFGLRVPPETSTRVDLGSSWVVSDEKLLTAPGWSPFHGLRVWGRVAEVRIRGRVAWDGERVLAAPGDGRDVARC